MEEAAMVVVQSQQQRHNADVGGGGAAWRERRQENERPDSSSDDQAAHEMGRKHHEVAESATCERKSGRPRKPTYVARKQEKQALHDEILLLEARMELLKLKAGLPSGEDTKSLVNMQASNADMEEAIHVNLLGIARVQSLLAHHLLSTPVEPISAYIHLTLDPDQRCATLRSLRDVKLRRATELVAERLGGLDPLKPYMAEERFLTEKNVFHCKRADIHQFRGLAGGAKQLFDALLHFASHMEGGITEMLGQLTIREEMDFIEPTIWNHRLVSTTGAGYVQELNTVGFCRFVEPDANVAEQTPHGIIATDAVDKDDLYPYVPSQHVRKDVTASITVTEAPVDKNDPKSETVVVLKRCVFVKIHSPEAALPASVMDEVVANVSTWSTVMAKYLRDTVATSKRG